MPPTLADADAACYDPAARLAHMDANGIYAQVLYPNIVAFEGHAFMALGDEELKLACIRTYNDYQAEFASMAPERFILMAMLPFWDLEESVRELRRCQRMGHREPVHMPASLVRFAQLSRGCCDGLRRT